MGHLYRQLSQEERLEIYHLSRLGLSILQIGLRLGRAASTISRELSRNSQVCKVWQGGYDPVRAQWLTRRRRQCDKSRYKLVRHPTLLQYVADRLAMGWSPQQNAGRRAQEGHALSVSAESIYRYIYYRREQKDYMFRLLPRRKSRRGRRKSCNSRSEIHRMTGRMT